jgi:hypothetical protein
MSAALLIAFMAGALLSLAPVAIYEYTKRMRK